MSDAAFFPLNRAWPLREAIKFAGILEASAPKAGNVHPGRGFDDMYFGHFVAAAECIATEISKNVDHDSVGQLVLRCVRTITKQVGVNTSLGTILLVAPIAKAHSLASKTLEQEHVAEVLGGLNAEDSRLVYEAIADCLPGGIGEESQNDVRGDAPDDLIQAMSQVSEFDAVARQYVDSFQEVFVLAEWLGQELANSCDCLDAICRVQLRWLSHQVDGLIVRKLSQDRALEVVEQAQVALQRVEGSKRPLSSLSAYQEFDEFLRSDGNRLNPGTTADLIAAALLVKLLG